MFNTNEIICLHIISTNIVLKMLFMLLIIILIIAIIVIMMMNYDPCHIDDTYANPTLPTAYVIDYANDVSELNKLPVSNIIYVKTTEDIMNVMDRATKENKHISIRGQKHSMGGHTIAEMGYVIDMKYMNNVIETNIINKYVSVEAGMSWHELIVYLNKFGYSPMILQSYSTFSIGGSISVNAHGVTSDNSVSSSVIEIKAITSDGTKVTCNKHHNSELFSLIMGGYGLFAIIYGVTLKIVPNRQLELSTFNLNISNFVKKYEELQKDKTINIKLARIDITNMNDIYLYVLKHDIKKSKQIIVSNLSSSPHEMSYPSNVLYKWLLPLTFFQKIRYKIENFINKPIDIPKLSSRNDILYESATPMAKLYSPFVTLNKTHILQEYFIPKKHFSKWMSFLKYVFVNINSKNISLLNITIRYINKDNNTFLNYAKHNMYAFVFYYRINKNKCAVKELIDLEHKLINMTVDLNGTFYLPYLCSYTEMQLKKAYPHITQFIKLKQSYDKNNLFSNKWYRYIVDLCYVYSKN